MAETAKALVDDVEEAGVLARGADRLEVEKLARYFMRTFKDNQLGKKGANIKETVGTDLRTLTGNDVFRFPSTFTFISIIRIHPRDREGPRREVRCHS